MADEQAPTFNVTLTRSEITYLHGLLGRTYEARNTQLDREGAENWQYERDVTKQQISRITEALRAAQGTVTTST